MRLIVVCLCVWGPPERRYLEKNVEHNEYQSQHRIVIHR